MVARYSDATKLKQAKFLAREGRCFIVERSERVRVLDCNMPHYIDRIYWLVYRQGEPRNVFVGKRSSIDGLLSLVKKATNFKK